MRTAFGLTVCAALVAGPAVAEDDADALSKKLANPVASLISVPFQGNFEFNGGPDGDGFLWTTNVQPVIPISLNEDWNLIVRTIVPVVYREDYGPVEPFGLGDTTQSFFFSPKQPVNGITWAVGPVFLWPTETSSTFGAGKWGAGITALVLKIDGPWTIGILANHIWDFAGQSERDSVSATFLQPFVNYAFGDGLSAALNTESSYDWVHKAWTVPLNVSVSQVISIGEQKASIGVGAKYYAERPPGTPEWGARLIFTLIFPT